MNWLTRLTDDDLIQHARRLENADARAVALCEIERRMKCDPDKTWMAPLRELLDAIQEHLFTDVQISPDNETRENANALWILIEHFREQHLPLERKAAE